MTTLEQRIKDVENEIKQLKLDKQVGRDGDGKVIEINGDVCDLLKGLEVRVQASYNGKVVIVIDCDEDGDAALELAKDLVNAAGDDLE